MSSYSVKDRLRGSAEELCKERLLRIMKAIDAGTGLAVAGDDAMQSLITIIDRSRIAGMMPAPLNLSLKRRKCFW